jgi:CRISPR-associated protein Csh1
MMKCIGSDGNSFKTINIIQDINGLYFDNMIVNLQKTHRLFDNLKGFDWDTIMTYKNSEGELITTGFNFSTIYRCIPARKNPTGKKYKNIALSFFKAILEQRKIDRQQIFEYFRDLILCHRFKRYDGYENVRPAYSKYPKSKFDNCVIQAVCQYAAIIHFLEKLNLIKNDKNVSKMEIQDKSTPAVSEASKQIEDFFEKMHYTSEQRAMFYLGKVLNWIGFAQSAKQHESKPILGHVNYNGMDYNAIVRLKKELFLKIKQYHKFSYKGKTYNSFSTCGYWLDQFEKHFSLNHEKPTSWQLSREATLFYLLSGYSFRTEKEIPLDDDNEDSQ